MNIGYGLNVSDLWRRNFLVLVGFFLLFQLTQVLLIEYFPVCYDGVRPGRCAHMELPSNTAAALR